MIPSFLLAKLYVKGSLKNNEAGFEFALKNIIDSTMLTGIGPINIGEKSYEAEAVTLTVGEKTVNGDQLSRGNSVPVRMGVPIKVLVAGEPLPAGPQKITVAATTSDIGKIKFDISDTVASPVANVTYSHLPSRAHFGDLVKKLLPWILLLLFLSACAPSQAPVLTSRNVYYVGAEGEVKTALSLAGFTLVNNPDYADVFVLNGDIPNAAGIAERVNDGALAGLSRSRSPRRSR